VLGIKVRAVLAYLLKGKNKTYFTKASKRIPIDSRSTPTTTEETKKPQPIQTLPKPQQSYIPTYFCCEENTSRLHRVNLLTGERSCHYSPSYQFKLWCRWSELPGGIVLITGGGNPTVREVEKIDTLREFAVSSLPLMHSARRSHAVLYHSQYLYVLGGGFGDRSLSECERYSCAESRWEVLPALPYACDAMSAVEVENSVYALGGWNGGRLDTVQKLSLASLIWELMQLKLPQANFYFSCFKRDTEVYLVIEETLYCFTPLQFKVRTLSTRNTFCYSSCYSRGTLYYERGSGIESLALRI
jgi:hypothetical protein